MTTRRDALALLIATSSASLLARAKAPGLSPRQYGSMVVIDAKCSLRHDPPQPNPGYTPDLLRAARESGLTMISQTHGGSGTMEALEASVARTNANIAAYPTLCSTSSGQPTCGPRRTVAVSASPKMCRARMSSRATHRG